jgi:hypothetical protein
MAPELPRDSTPLNNVLEIFSCKRLESPCDVEREISESALKPIPKNEQLDISTPPPP